MSEDIYLTTKELGAKARELRRAAGESQTEVAGALGVTQAVVSEAEGGKSQYVKTAARIIERYGGRVERVAHFRVRLPDQK